MADIYSMLMDGMNAAESGRKESRRRGLADLMGKAYSAPQDQRQQYIAQAASIDPDAAFAAQKNFGEVDNAAHKELGRTAKMIVAAPPEMRPQLWKQAHGKLAAMGFHDMKPDWSEDILPMTEKIAAMFGDTADNGMFSQKIGADGYIYNTRKDGSVVNTGVKADRQMWLRDHPGMPGGPELVGKDGAVHQVGSPHAPQGQPAAGQPAPQGLPQRPVGVMDEAYLDSLTDSLVGPVEQQESGGNVNAVSPKGAVGPMQIMPATGRDPGYGVAPLRDGSPQENRRFGRDYLKAMLRKFDGNVELALAAYNGGPGRMENNLASAGGDPSAAVGRMPSESRQYVPGVLNRTGGQSPQQPSGVYARPSEAQVAGESEAAKEAARLAVKPQHNAYELQLATDKAVAEGAVKSGYARDERNEVRSEELRAQLPTLKASQRSLLDAYRGLQDGRYTSGPITGMVPDRWQTAANQQLATTINEEILAVAERMKGTLSDKDVAFLRSATFGLDKQPQANMNIIGRKLQIINDAIKRGEGGGQQQQPKAAPPSGGFRVLED